MAGAHAMILYTKHLDLVPMTLALLDADLESSTRLGEALEAEVPQGWPPGEFDRDALGFFQRMFHETGCSQLEWGNYYVLGREPRVAVAAAGYHGAPDHAGSVEIGYSVVQEARGRGYATEIVGALVDNAFTNPVIRRVAAQTLASNPASVAVLRKNGFVDAGGSAESLRFVRER